MQDLDAFDVITFQPGSSSPGISAICSVLDLSRSSWFTSSSDELFASTSTTDPSRPREAETPSVPIGRDNSPEIVSTG